jgi:hypothetical protein
MYEGSLGEVHFAGDLLHLRVADIGALYESGELVA